VPVASRLFGRPTYRWIAANRSRLSAGENRGWHSADS